MIARPDRLFQDDADDGYLGEDLNVFLIFIRRLFRRSRLGFLELGGKGYFPISQSEERGPSANG